jgi:Mg2+-importing ATPase
MTSAAARSLTPEAAGLTDAEARRRLAEQGPNEVSTVQPHPVLTAIANQLRNRLVGLLVAAAVVAYAVGERVDAAVILVVVAVNALLGFAQEHRAERALRSLRAVLTRRALARRDGRLVEIDARDLVPGDVVQLQIGDQVPADLRLLSADELSADEATLTGESVPADKAVTDGPAGQMLMGTIVASGYGAGVVVATGGRTAFGQTAAALQAPADETDFQKGIRGFSALLLRVALTMTVFVFLVNLVLDRGVFESLLFAVALAVGIAPEALPAVITVALSTGALHLARQKVIVKRLIAVEDLGNIDVLCCDKTGTLTTGVVSLEDWVDTEGRRDVTVLEYGLLSGGPDLEDAAAAPRNSIDRAVWDAVGPAGMGELAAHARVLDRNEFDFRRRSVSALVDAHGARMLAVKGAPESLLPRVVNVQRAGNDEPLTAEAAAALTGRVAGLEQAGKRVLLVATRALDVTRTTGADETGLTVRGLLVLSDRPKTDARGALTALADLKVELKVLSGDSPTATAGVCREVGLAIAGGRIVTGDELEAVSPGGLRELARQCNVFARVSPDQKHRLVEALRAEGRVVGFLGDGVNDAPALRAADVGIAVDTGAGVAKDAADIVLLEKSLAVLADGIVGGRRTFANITKYIFNTMSANFGNMTTIAASSLFLPFIPLLPGQILLNNLLSDVPLMALSTDRVEEDLLRRPRRWHLGAITRFMVWFGVLSAVFDIVLILGMMRWLHTGVDAFRTAWFVESACSEILVTFAIRTRGAFYRGRPGAALVLLSLLALGVAALLPITGVGQRFFSFVPLPLPLSLLIAGVLLAYFVSAESLKRWFFTRTV